jgi:dihydrofolate reductase
MAEDAFERVRRDFLGRAPELRKTLVAELGGLLDRCAVLSQDEADVLRHVFAYAGYSLDGGLYIPAFAVLWGGEESYFPAVGLPAPRVRAAAEALRRRGVLRDVKWTARTAAASHTEGVFVEAPVLRELAAGKAAPAPAAAQRRLIVCAAASLDGYVLPVPAMPEGDFETARGSAAAVARAKRKSGRDLVREASPAVLHALLKGGEIDELLVWIIPVLLGRGTPLFKRGREEQRLKLVETKPAPTGVVLLRYARN